MALRTCGEGPCNPTTCELAGALLMANSHERPAVEAQYRRTHDRPAALLREGELRTAMGVPSSLDGWRVMADQPQWRRDDPPNGWRIKTPATTRDARELPDGWQAKQPVRTAAADALPDGWARGGGR